MKGRAIRYVMPVLVAVVFLAVFALRWTGQGALFTAILQCWGVRTFPLTFVDTHGVLAAIECVRRGVDVYAVNPCDVIGRVFNYPPSWLAARLLPVTVRWTEAAGSLLGIGFLTSLFLLPPARRARDALLLSLAGLSTTVAFALERGNVDLLIFVIAVGAAHLLGRRLPARIAAYAAMLLAGLLKLYPLTLLMLVIREAPARRVVIGGMLTFAVIWFGVSEHHDLIRMAGQVPAGSPFAAMFGASNLPRGVMGLLTPSRGWATAAEAGLLIYAGTLAWRWQPALRQAVSLLTPLERRAALIGALLLVGCFIAGQSVTYRGIHLLLVLPALLSLPSRFRRSAWLAVILLWFDWLQDRLDAALASSDWNAAAEGGFRMAVWGLREAAWWYVVTTLAAIAAALLLGRASGSRA